jgi:hypothetical protein
VRKTTVTYSFQNNQSIPMIRLRGKWLALAGFQEGQTVRVEIAKGRLTLTVAKVETT